MFHKLNMYSFTSFSFSFGLIFGLVSEFWYGHFRCSDPGTVFCNFFMVGREGDRKVAFQKLDTPQIITITAVVNRLVAEDKLAETPVNNGWF